MEIAYLDKSLLLLPQAKNPKNTYNELIFKKNIFPHAC